MNEFAVRALMENLQTISMMSLGYIAKRPGADLSEREREMALESVTMTKTILSFGEFPDSCLKIDKSIEWLKAMVFDASSTGTELRNITDAILDSVLI
jgi:hypothetical protein